MTRRIRHKALVWVIRPGERGPEVLLLERPAARGGGLHPVTGKGDPGEPPDRTAAREAAEETALTGALADLGHLHQFDSDRPDKKPTRWLEHAFLLAVAPAATPLLSDEHVAFRWVSAPEVKALLQWASHRETLDLALESFAAAAARR